MINCINLTNETLWKLLVGNNQFVYTSARATKWEEVVECIESLKMTCTEEQLKYIKDNHWKDEENEQV